MRKFVQLLLGLVWVASAAVMVFYGVQYVWNKHQAYVAMHTPHTGYFPYGSDQTGRALQAMHHIHQWLPLFGIISLVLVLSVVMLNRQRMSIGSLLN